MTEQEIRAAVLAALLDYENIKKTRRLKAVKKAVRGTVMATVIGSVGLAGAEHVRGKPQQPTQTVVNPAGKPAAKQFSGHQIIPGVAHFGLAQHMLLPAHQARLQELVRQLPEGAEVSVVGRTDSVGNFDYNKKLGRKRAQAVAEFLSANGLKVTAVASKVSRHRTGSWLARRVDVVLNHPTELAISLPPILDLYAATPALAQSAKPAGRAGLAQQEPNPMLLAVDRVNSQRPVTDKRVNSAKVAETNAQVKPTSSSPVANKSIRQKLNGAAYFDKGAASIDAEDKARLDLLLKQLPPKAELTVIGRTDSHGEKHRSAELGSMRALTVANYLANHGAMIAKVGAKAAGSQYHGWAARRVDILVNFNATTSSAITLPFPGQRQPVTGEDNHVKSGPLSYRKAGYVTDKLVPAGNGGYVNQIELPREGGLWQNLNAPADKTELNKARREKSAGAGRQL